MAKGNSGFDKKGKMTKAQRDKSDIRSRLQVLVDERGDGGGYHYTIEENNWENYGKSRTYYNIIETRDNSKHRSEYRFGYYDNKEEKYVAGKSDVYRNFNLAGSKFDIDEALKKRKKRK